jgi:hypothetical protein
MQPFRERGGIHRGVTYHDVVVGQEWVTEVPAKSECDQAQRRGKKQQRQSTTGLGLAGGLRVLPAEQ